MKKNNKVHFVRETTETNPMMECPPTPATGISFQFGSPTSNSPQSPNHWDNESDTTIKEWRAILNKKVYIYEFVSNRISKRSDALMIISIILTSALGILSSIKVQFKNNESFDKISDYILMAFNFINALLVYVAKRYNNDKRNTIIDLYITDLNKLLGNINTQLSTSISFRDDAREFITKYMVEYNRLITNSPPLSLKEERLGSKAFSVYTRRKSSSA